MYGPWRCCGIESGRSRKLYDGWSNHCRWYHWGENAGRSRYSIGFTRGWIPGRNWRIHRPRRPLPVGIRRRGS